MDILISREALRTRLLVWTMNSGTGTQHSMVSLIQQTRPARMTPQRMSDALFQRQRNAKRFEKRACASRFRTHVPWLAAARVMAYHMPRCHSSTSQATRVRTHRTSQPLGPCLGNYRASSAQQQRERRALLWIPSTKCVVTQSGLRKKTACSDAPTQRSVANGTGSKVSYRTKLVSRFKVTGRTSSNAASSESSIHDPGLGVSPVKQHNLDMSISLEQGRRQMCIAGYVGPWH